MFVKFAITLNTKDSMQEGLPKYLVGMILNLSCPPHAYDTLLSIVRCCQLFQPLLSVDICGYIF